MNGRSSMAQRRLFALACAVCVGCTQQPKPGEVQDEARKAGRVAASFPHADEDYFHDMDRGAALTPEEIKGRNMWLVWSGGNDRLWNAMTDYTFGAFDMLKIVSSHPSLGYSRDNRWNYFGIINEPCFDKPNGPDKTRRGLWLDVRRAGLPGRPVRKRGEVPGRGDRRARQAVGRRHDPAGRLVLRLRHRHRRPAALSQSGLRREGGARPGTPSGITPIRRITTART